MISSDVVTNYNPVQTNTQPSHISMISEPTTPFSSKPISLNNNSRLNNHNAYMNINSSRQLNVDQQYGSAGN